MQINEISYTSFTDNYDGSESTYTVENVIMTLNHNPNQIDNLIGYYTIFIREDSKASKILRPEGVQDTTTYFTFNGKFKIYTDKEMKYGKNWVELQNDLKDDIVDSSGVYNLPDKITIFKKGEKRLKEILDVYKTMLIKEKTYKKNQFFIEIVVSKKGEIIQDSLHTNISNKKVIDLIIKNSELMNNWLPAIRRNEYVKSKINLII